MCACAEETDHQGDSCGEYCAMFSLSLPALWANKGRTLPLTVSFMLSSRYLRALSLTVYAFVGIFLDKLFGFGSQFTLALTFSIGFF